MTTDSRSRKWLITINNPIGKGFTHDVIKQKLANFSGCVYWCMSDEIGLNEQTPHTHIFIVCPSGVRFSTLKKHFEGGHFDICRGTSSQNRDYVFKEGKYAGSSKEDTRVDGAQEEWGELPVERQGQRNDLVDLFDMINAGLSDYDILQTCPEHLLNLTQIAQTRQVVQQEKHKDEWRNLSIEYIWGDTGTGKTRYVMDKYGYSNVYRVTNYKHPFDSYRGEDVILFEEFRSSLPLCDMLKYMDGYPCYLPARFADRYALFTKVYFTTNVPLEKQYETVQRSELQTWRAFLRRIDKISHFTPGKVTQLSLDDYLSSLSAFENDNGSSPWWTD